MIRFFTKIFVVTIFFIGLGAVVETAWKIVIPTENDLVIANDLVERTENNLNINYLDPNTEDCKKVKIFKLEKRKTNSVNQFKFRVVLPNLENLPDSNFNPDNSNLKKNIVVFRQLPQVSD